MNDFVDTSSRSLFKFMAWAAGQYRISVRLVCAYSVLYRRYYPLAELHAFHAVVSQN